MSLARSRRSSCRGPLARSFVSRIRTGMAGAGVVGMLSLGAAACGDDAVKPGGDAATDAVFVPSDAVASDSSASDAALPDTSVADTSVADTSVADTSVADTSVADTSVADTSVADTGVKDTGTPADITPEDTVAPDAEPDVAVPKVGESCASPGVLADPDGDDHYDALGSIGAASGLADDLDASACGQSNAQTNGSGQRDEVWRFVAPAAGEYQVQVLSDTVIDVILYAFDDGACGTTCLGFDDSSAAGDIDTMFLTLASGDAVFIVVDGKGAAHAGDYLVDVYDCGGTCTR